MQRFLKQYDEQQSINRQKEDNHAYF